MLKVYWQVREKSRLFDDVDKARAYALELNQSWAPMGQGWQLSTKLPVFIDPVEIDLEYELPLKDAYGEDIVYSIRQCPAEIGWRVIGYNRDGLAVRCSCLEFIHIKKCEHIESENRPLNFTRSSF